ncbi:UNVERIFIED_CONTAM: hypothetical protein GTU68_014395 [Idotea baltica]|nr:hypothetical protein [Idotea baltica]
MNWRENIKTERLLLK